LTFCYDNDIAIIKDWEDFQRTIVTTLSTTLDVSQREIKVLGVIRGSIEIIIAATGALIAAIYQAPGIPTATRALLISTVAGAGMGAATGSPLGPLGITAGGSIGAAIGFVVGAVSLSFN
jgi:hypothetical protein